MLKSCIKQFTKVYSIIILPFLFPNIYNIMPSIILYLHILGVIRLNDMHDMIQHRSVLAVK